MLKKYKNLKIASKLIIGFLIVAILAGVIGVIGVINISSLGGADTKLYEKNTLGIQYTGDASLYYQRVRFNVVKGLLAAGSSNQADSLSKISDYEAKVDENLKSFQSCIVNQDSQNTYNELLPKWDTYKKMVGETIDLMNAGQNDDAKALIFGDLQTAANDLQTSFDQIVIMNVKDAQLTADNNKQVVKTSMILMIGVAIAGIVIALILGVAISRIIGKPIIMVAGDADKLAIGNVDIDSAKAEAGNDEIGRLIEAFKKLAAGSKNQVRDTQRLADGDLTVDIIMKSDKDILNQSLITLVDNLNDLVVSIKSSAEQVASGANLVSETSMALSQGATEQASSVEQLTASLQEIALQTTLNAEHAQSANQFAKNAKADAESGNAQMKDMLGAMEDINQSSASINKIIKVIDDIAFQTNILALNAAVEAARAGQHGKGFAVVAEEVRTLAAKSAQAAKETTDMIENSIKKVEIGTRIASQTATALGKIVNEVAKAANLVEDIASASNEQANAIEQVNQGIAMVSSVVQSNAATSEESAAASEELSSQADQLKEIISTFKVKQSAASMGAGIYKAAAKKTEKPQSPGGRRIIQGSKSNISLGDGDFGKY